MGTTHELHRGAAPVEVPAPSATVRLVYELLRERGFAIQLDPGDTVSLVHIASGDRWPGFGRGETTAMAAVDAYERFTRLADRMREPVRHAPPHLRLIAGDQSQVRAPG